MDTDAVAKYPAQAAGWPWTWPRVRSSTLEQRLLSGARAVLSKRGPCRNLSILAEVRPLTGEPDAGDPHVRFGGRGGDKLSLPLSHRFLCFNQLMKTVVVGTAGHIDHGKSSLVKA